MLEKALSYRGFGNGLMRKPFLEFKDESKTLKYTVGKLEDTIEQFDRAKKIKKIDIFVLK
ncbi:MAG: hypothetical protein PWQ48_1725 [Thermotogaceae bacterium]|nr:hypothetical protein [Thermotogaceae bacterium]